MAQVDAIIIGGGAIRDQAFREAAGNDCKSLIPLAGKPMIQWVAEALHHARKIRSVVVIGPDALSRTELGGIVHQIVTEGSHEVENLMKGMDALLDSDRILMLSSDMPLLTPGAVDDLIENTPDADIVYPIVSKHDILEEFPHRSWVFVKAREGEFTGSSAVLFRPSVFREHRETLKKVFDSRRSVADLVRMWGIGFALKFALGRLSLADAEQRISDVLHVSGRAYVSHYPELAFDVDKAADIYLAVEKLRGRNPALREVP